MLKSYLKNKIIAYLSKYPEVLVQSLRLHYGPRNMNLVTVDYKQTKELKGFEELTFYLQAIRLTVVSLHKILMKERSDSKYVRTIGSIVHFIKL